MLTRAIAVRACVSCVNNHLEITDLQPKKNSVIYIIIIIGLDRYE